MDSKNIIIVVVVLAVVALAWWYISSQGGQSGLVSVPTPTVQLSPTPTPEATEAASQPAQVSVVTISSSGFSPQEIKIKASESVTWMNSDSEDHQVLSAVHPTHQVYPPLNTIGLLKAGQQKSLNFPDKGTYRYHDHLNPSSTGSVVVE